MFQIFRMIMKFHHPDCTFALPSLTDVLWYAKPLQLYPTLCNCVDCSLPGSSVHGILQARILLWVAISFSTISYC